VLLYAVLINHVRALETIVLAISRPERVISPELRTVPLVGLAPWVLWVPGTPYVTPFNVNGMANATPMRRRAWLPSPFSKYSS
jgi:hypothetical protein